MQNINLNNLKRSFDLNIVEGKKESKIAKKEGSFAKLPLDLIKEILSFVTVHQIPVERHYWGICKSIKDFDTTRYLYDKMIGGNEKYKDKDDIAFMRHLWKENPITIGQIKFFRGLMEKDPTVFKGKLENGGEKDAFDTTFQFLMNELNPDFEPSLTGIKNIDYLIKEREAAIITIWEYIFNTKEKEIPQLIKLCGAFINLWRFFPKSFNNILARFVNSEEQIYKIPYLLVSFLKGILESIDQSKNMMGEEKVNQTIAGIFFAYQILVEKEENNTEELENHVKDKFFKDETPEFAPLLSLALLILPKVKLLYSNDKFMHLFVTNFYNEVTDQFDEEDDSSGWNNEKIAEKCEEIFEMCTNTLKQDPSFIKTLYLHPKQPEFLLKHLNEKNKKSIQDWYIENRRLQVQILDENSDVESDVENEGIQESLDAELVDNAFKINSGISRGLSLAYHSYEDIVFKAVKADPKNIWCMHKSLVESKKVMTEFFSAKHSEIVKIVVHFPHTIKFASSWMWQDKEIVYILVRQNSSNYRLISEGFKKDKDFLGARGVLELASSSIRDDKELMLSVLKAHPSKYKFISERLQKDEDILKFAKKE